MDSPLVGLVSYADDPEGRVFRVVFPEASDPPDVLDWPRWITDGIAPGRLAVMRKVPANSEEARAGFTGEA